MKIEARINNTKQKRFTKTTSFLRDLNEKYKIIITTAIKTKGNRITKISASENETIPVIAEKTNLIKAEIVTV